MANDAEVERVDAAAAPAAAYRPLRIWPVPLLLGGMAVTRYLPQMVDGGEALWMWAAFGPVACGGLILVWWLIVSRAKWSERLAGFLGVLVALTVTMLLADRSMRGPATMVLTIPMGLVGFSLGAWLSYRVLSFRRTLVALTLALVGFSYSLALRSDGMWGNFALGLHWRWTPSSDEILLRSNEDRRATDVSAKEIETALGAPEWPGFRGPNRDGRQSGPAIATDWSIHPPELLWKVTVGPGWSSFAVAGSLLFTQEQRGNSETVVCYAADSGREVWTRQQDSRFDDPLGGPGPRATPTLVDEGLFVMGATGLLMRLDPGSGEVIWRQDLREIAGRQPPMWGFSSSPLVVGSAVILYAGGADGKGILAFETDSGRLKWSAPAGDQSYCSPHLAQVAGERLVLLTSAAGLHGLDPDTGAERLNYEWPIENYRAIQPQVVGDNSVLVASGMGDGARLVRLSSGADGLSSEVVWNSTQLKPEFNDFVVYRGHAYGFDGAIFTCLDLETGKRTWKGGRYGKGQVLLLEANGLVLVAGEHGEVVLLKADPTASVELGRFQAIEGRTWNHPVVVGDRLYVRNSQEAACYRLPLADDAPAVGLRAGE